MIYVHVGCEAAELREELWHDWLKNDVGIIPAADVAAEFPKEWRSKYRQSFEGKIAQGGSYDKRVEQVYELVDRVPDGFSPARLLDAGPIAEMPEEARQLVASYVHERYLREAAAADWGSGIRRSVKAFKKALEGVREAWGRDSQASNAAQGVEDALVGLQKAALKLRAALESLPRGFVIPSAKPPIAAEIPTRILVIDDQYGDDEFLRESFCRRCSLVAVTASTTDDELVEHAEGSIAGAVFCSGQVEKKNSFDEVRRAVSEGWPSEAGWRWSLVMLDVRFTSGAPDTDASFGNECRKRLKELYPDLPLVMLTSKPQADLPHDVENYLSKEGVSERQVTSTLLRSGLLTRRQSRRLLGLSDEVVFESEAMRQVFVRAFSLASTDEPVLILGESGVGKEMVARYIHEASPRHAGVFLPVNVGSIARTLVESELFGHEKGAFTDAKERKRGIFEEAEGGTVFLDEIGLVPEAIRGSLLRVLQEKKIRRVGGVEELGTDFRLVSATSRDIPVEAARGDFYPDLYYRLETTSIEVPPLRRRREDIVPLARAYIADKKGEGCNIVISDEAGDFLSGGYDYPGNVRELQNILAEIIADKTNNSVITRKDVERHLETKRRRRAEAVEVHEGEENGLPPNGAAAGTPAFHRAVDARAPGMEELLALLATWRIDPDDHHLRELMVRLEATVQKLKRRIWGATLHMFREKMGDKYKAHACEYLFGKEATDNPSSKASQEILKLLPDGPLKDSATRNRTPDEVIDFLIAEWKDAEKGEGL